MSNKSQFRRAVQSIGATFTESDDKRYLVVDSPIGKVFKSNGEHCLASGAAKGELMTYVYTDLIDRINWGVENCEIDNSGSDTATHCEFCCTCERCTQDRENNPIEFVGK